MTKKLTNNWILKLLSLVVALLVWLVVVNINNPTDSRLITVEVKLLNADVLAEKNLAYEVVGNQSVNVTIQTRTMYKKYITDGDIELTADLATLFEPTGAVEIKYNILNNHSYIDKVELSRKTIQIKTEDMQTKSFDLSVKMEGEPAEGYVAGNAQVIPTTIRITGPVSIIGRINSVGVKADLADASSNVSGVGIPILYDANGNELDSIRDRLTFQNEEIQYNVEILKAKSVNLEYLVAGEEAEGYRFTGVQAIQQIALAGEPSLVESIDSIRVINDDLTVQGATTDTMVTIDLAEYLPEGITIIGMSDTRVNVVMKVAALSQRTITLRGSQIRLLNEDADYDYEWTDGNSAEVSIIVEGLQEELDALDANSLDVSIDVRNRGTGVYDEIINIVLPENIRLVNTPRISLTIDGLPEETTESTTVETTEAEETEDIEVSGTIEETEE